MSAVRHRLTDLDRLTLLALADAPSDWFLSFNGIAAGGVPRHDVRRVVRKLARKGLTQFSSGLWSDDGTPAGSGYALTNERRAVVDALPDPTIPQGEQ